ncbi:hypothetical protein OIDMADRAFT_57083 [Oidiodendron maius Zn]|uniref:Lysine-specific metallo-endopeptidase domain-containing protein n=1 Tax=Oidiodendron maius (strain Zn) TaxID=913774 RepID=A0A0C3H619_OIDMZ|nr:hypothetical protein OIDMADRAFT_57083 [Oidiodendron maius Zn]
MSPSIFSTVAQLVITAIWMFSLSPNFCKAWSIDSSCIAFPQVQAAMTEALNLVIYAKLRAANAPPRLGTSMVDLLAAPNENDPNTLEFVQTWYQNVIDAASVPSPDGIVIQCTDANLTPIDLANRKYIDTKRGNKVVYAPKIPGATLTDNACGGFIKAFAYPADRQQIVLLCSDSNSGALKSSYSDLLGPWRTAGDLTALTPVKEKGLDALGMYLSTMILHELMHAASMAEQLKKLQFAQFPAILPDEVNGQPIGEIYQYSPISGKQLGDSISSGQSTVNNLQHNADSMALLAASWYLPVYKWVNGKCGVIPKADRAPATFLNTPTPPGPS